MPAKKNEMEFMISVGSFSDMCTAAHTFSCSFDMFVWSNVSKDELDLIGIFIETGAGDGNAKITLQDSDKEGGERRYALAIDGKTTQYFDRKKVEDAFGCGYVFFKTCSNISYSAEDQDCDGFEPCVENLKWWTNEDGVQTIQGSCHFNVTGTFKESFELQNFPLDVQDLNVQMCFLAKSGTRFIPSIPSDWNVDIRGLECNDHLGTLGEWRHPKLKLSVESNTIVFTLCVAREWYPYLWRIFIVLAAVTASTLPVFEMDPVHGFADRLGHIATMFLTGVAFLNIVFTIVPNIPYLTFMDKYVTGCTLFIAFEMLLVTLAFVDPERDEQLSLLSHRGFYALQVYFVLYAVFCRHSEMSKMTKPLAGDSVSRAHGMGTKLFLSGADQMVETESGMFSISNKGDNWQVPKPAATALPPTKTPSTPSGSFL
jgi:hypothetical protein